MRNGPNAENFGQFLANQLIAEPENVFLLPTLTYKSSEIQDILDHFDRARFERAAYPPTVNLLQATLNFRYATEPSESYVSVRNSTFSDQELESIFENVLHAFERVEEIKQAAHADNKNQRILQNVLNYCQLSVQERIASLKSHDRLLPIWMTSKLKIYLEQ